MVQTDFEKELIFYEANASKVAIAGCFTSWKPSLLMNKEGTNKWVYKAILPIIEG